MREQVRVTSRERTQPAPDRFGMAPEPFVLAKRPPHDESINRAEFGAKLRGIEATIVAYPATEDGPKALRSLRSRPDISDDEIVERLEGRLARAQEASAAKLPWGGEFKRRARRKER
jgi:hypothetical protein